MNIFGSSLETFILCNSLIILETKMLESWCNSLPGKQIYEYLGQQAAAERWSIWQPAKYALLQLPNKLRISFPNLKYSFLINISIPGNSNNKWKIVSLSFWPFAETGILEILCNILCKDLGIVVPLNFSDMQRFD